METADGYLTRILPKSDMGGKADAVARLAKECVARGIPFLYVNAPFKVCTREDASMSGVSDFSNQNSDELLASLGVNGVRALDLRAILHEEGLSHHELFYRTDHHWLPSTGMWAARRLAEEINSMAGCDLDASRIEPGMFTSKVCPEWFLGSQGKKVTLSRAVPEDFELYYPAYATNLRYRIPALGIDEAGDFSVLYDMRQVNVRDYYNKNPYAAYIYADQPLETIENLDVEGGPHVLVVHDSFGNCVVPFLSLVAGRVDSIDLRSFDGSLWAYIEAERLDVVVVMYNPSAFG